MRCLAYYDSPDDGNTYDKGPAAAAREFANDCAEHASDQDYDIIVEPADDEARALPGWKVDIRGPYLIFRAIPPPLVGWSVEGTNKRRTKEV